MVLSREKLILWLLTILIIGLASGYLFSSKFCRVSINKRVDKIAALNQELRKLLVHHTVWTYHYLQSRYLNYEDQEATAQKLSQNNEAIGLVFATYYGQSIQQKIVEMLNAQKKNLDKALEQLESGITITVDFKNTARDLSDYLEQLKILPSDAQEFSQMFISTMGIHFIEIIKAWQSKNWQKAFAEYENNLEISRESADDLDRIITNEFPYKF